MKLKWLCLICCLSLCLAGCGGAGEVSSASDTPPASTVSLPETPENGAIQDIVDSAPVMSLLAILSNPSVETYQALGTPAQELELAASFPGLQPDTILFIPLQDDLQILVEEVEYHYNLNWFDVTKTLYDFPVEYGTPYSLKTSLPEGIPQVRITAVWGGRQLSWYCTYDGIGDPSVSYLSLSQTEGVAFSYGAPYAAPISGAVAVNHLLFDDPFWESVIHAATLVEEPGPGPIIVSQERFHQYVEMIHPGLTAWPELIEEVQYSEKDDAYIFDPYNNDPIATWEAFLVEENADGGSVWINVTCPNLDEFPITYEVVWRFDNNYQGTSPFAFFITGIIQHEAVG